MPSEKKGITVRFEDEEMQKIDDLAKSYHVNATTVIRWAIKALAEYVEAHDGKITLPLDFSAFYQRASDEAARHRPHLAAVAQDPVSYPAKKRGRAN